MIAETFQPTRPSEEAVALLLSNVANDVAVGQVEILEAETPRERYFRLRDELRALTVRGRLEEAAEVASEAAQVAEEIGDEELRVLARLNVIAVGISLGQLDRHLGDLRSLLMRNFNVQVSFHAAYHLAHAYELKKNFKKSLFYARIARDRAEARDDKEFRAQSRCQVGAALVGDSQFSEASESFETALELMSDPCTPEAFTARIFLGYCKIILRRRSRGFGILFRALRETRRRELPIFESWARTYLSFAYLEIGRVRRAWIHARRALALAEDTGDYDAIKTSLFLLGEIEATAGDTPAALEWFRQMQERFYPEHESTPQLMAAVGTLGMVNLGA